MKNPPLAFALAALIFIATFGGNDANAYALSNFIKQAEVIKVNAVQSATSSAIKVTTTIRGFAANDPYQIKTIDVPKTSFMGHVKGNIKTLAKRNAWYAGWLATMAAAGWAIDELTNQVVSTPKFYTGSCEYPGRFQVSVEYNQCILNYLGTSYKLDKAVPISGPFPMKINIPTQFQIHGCLTFSPFTCSQLSIVTFKPTTISNSQPVPVPDDALYDSLVSHMLQDPIAAAQAFMVPDPWPYPYPQIFPDTVPYIPGVAQSDEEALDLYLKGLLQSTNPSAAHYVTPERYQQIAALAGQLQQGLTPESQVGELNDQIKKPLTQKELEESLKKEREAEDKATKEALGTAPALDTLLDPYNQFEQKVKDTPQDEINELPDNNYSISGQGRCYVIEKPIGIMGTTITLSTREFCDAYYYPYFLPILTWFFYVATGIYVWFSLRDAYSRRV